MSLTDLMVNLAGIGLVFGVVIIGLIRILLQHRGRP